MILLTGFEPFGGLDRNPSADLVRALAGDGSGVRGAVLPVDYRRVGPALADLLQSPLRAVVLLGVAVGRSSISLERVAINFRDPTRPDNAGALPESAPVVPGGPDAYFATLPIERMRRAVVATGAPVELSLSAGAYLCNAAFYLARHKLDAQGTPCGFVHLPPTPDLACGAAPLALDRQIEAVRAMLTVLGDSAAGKYR